jgi:hypothetical protein
MTGDRVPRIQDYLEGLLSPAASAQMRELLDADPDARREYRRQGALLEILNTSQDVEPPHDLSASILAAVRADAAQRARRRLPAFAENGLVLAGVAALATLVVQTGRIVDPADVVARLTVAGAQGFHALTAAVVGFASSWAQLDWIARLVATLSSAVRTVLAASAEPIMGISVLMAALTALLGFAIFRSHRFSRGGGLGHVRLLF